MTHPDKGSGDDAERPGTVEGMGEDMDKDTEMDRDIEELVEDFEGPFLSIRVKIGMVTMGLVAMGLASSYLPGTVDRLLARPVHIWLGLLSAFIVMLLPGPVRSTSEGRRLLTILLAFLVLSFLVLVFVDTAWPEPVFPNGSLYKGAADSGLVWDKILKSRGKESEVWLNPLPSGDYLVSSSVYSREKPSQLIIWRVDNQGNILWEKSPEINCPYIRVVIGLDNEDLLVIGPSTHPGSDEKNGLYLARIKAGEEGDLVWQRSYFGEKSWIIRTGVQTDDGGFLLAGYNKDLEKTRGSYTINTTTSSTTHIYDTYLHDILVLRIDKDGELIWEKTWDQGWEESIKHIQSSEDGGYILWGPGRPEEGIIVTKIDDLGQILWQKNIQLEHEIHSAPTCNTGDGGFIIAHSHPNKLPSGYSISAVKIDGKGDLVWEKRYPVGERYLTPRGIIESSEGGIVVFCEEYDSESQIPHTVYMLSIDENGGAKKKELETKLFLRDVMPITSGVDGYILAGTGITWRVNLPLTKWYHWYDIDTRLLRVDVDWAEEEVFVPVREVDPVWSRFPIHGREPTEIDLERGYRLISQDITCTVYYTADFARINYAITVEILNQSLNSIQIKVPYGDNEIWRTEEIQPRATLAYYQSAELDVEVEQDRDETNITIFLLPEMVEKGKAIIHFLYRIFDLPGDEGVLAFNEAYRKGNTRWEQGVLVNYSPGLMDQGTWILNFTMKPNSDEIIPTYWDPQEAIQITYDHTNFQRLFWEYVGEIPQTPVFKAIYRYPL